MDFLEVWYGDEQVKKLLEQIRMVMDNYQIDKMSFESNSDFVEFTSNAYKVKTGTSTMFHLEMNDGKIIIDL